MSDARCENVPPSGEDPKVRPVELRARGPSGAVAIGSPSPSLSWRLAAERPDVLQLGYEVQVGADDAFGESAASSGFVRSSSPIDAPWPAPPLNSREARWARVRVWTDRGVTGWADPVRIEAALLAAEDWIARPISPQSNVGARAPRPPALVRRGFRIDAPVRSARLYVSALGVHETWINGVRVGDALLDPGWTAYRERLLYAAYDVTDSLRQGGNAIAAAIGDGWWRGYLGWRGERATYGETTALLAQLEIVCEDGSTLVVATDPSWKGGTGALRSADIYKGAQIDLRQEPHGWRDAGFDDGTWEPVRTLPPSGLELRSAPPVRIVETRPVRPAETAWGTLLIDSGQNLAGQVRLRARGQGKITVRHAEVLDGEGRLYTAALRGADATDGYVLAGDGPVDLQPAFTFHGFRYAEIIAEPGISIEEAAIQVISSDLEQIGTFRCDDERLNRLFENVRWSQRSNFLSLPTDCPQRDERMGWTGDIQVFAETACANADARDFLASWLKDLALEQRRDGCVPSTAPNVIHGHPFEYGGVGWGDAATLVPWALHLAYGDVETLRAQFQSMRAWVDYGASRRNADGVWCGDFQLGDWLDPGAPPDRPHLATTSGDYIATAYLARSAAVVADAATILGDPTSSNAYRALSHEVATAAWSLWREHALGTQAGCAIAVEFGVAPPSERQLASDCLAAHVQRSGGRIATGFLGTPLVLPALARGGHVDVAYRLLLNEACPGWLYQVQHGATTMWERWDAIRPDGSIHRGKMASGENDSMMSFNHYAYGAVAAWLYRGVAGIAPTAENPGYGLIDFAPTPGGGLRFAEAEIKTPYGPASIAWSMSGALLSVRLSIPPGAAGRFRSPQGWRLAAGPGDAPLALGSGSHELVLTADP